MSRVDPELFRQLAAVVEDELEAQAGMHRSTRDLSDLVADVLFDYLDVEVRTGVVFDLDEDGRLR